MRYLMSRYRSMTDSESEIRNLYRAVGEMKTFTWKHCDTISKHRFDGVFVCTVCGKWATIGGKVRPAPAPDLLWVTRDKREVPMQALEDTHLMRALRFFKAKAVTIALSADDDRSPIEKAGAEILETDIRLRIEALEDEAKRRNLDKWDGVLGITMKGLL
jgi:hypothetical protein